MRNSRASDDFLEVANSWVALDAAARMLEEGKTAFFAQKCVALGDMPVNKAEQTVRSSEEWANYIKRMVGAKTEANKMKVRMDYMRMRFSEWQSDAANERLATKVA